MNSFNLETRRHSLAHLLATAVKSLYPEAKFGIGPVIDNGFYYDFDLPQSLTPEDLHKIEREMKRLIKENLAFDKKEIKIEEAAKLFKKLKQDYKVELLKDLASKGTTKLDQDEKEEIGASGSLKVAVYQTGDFTDLCRGPHVKSTKELSGMAFKLLSLAGAYWRGSEKNKMLQRIYGVAFGDQKELTEYLHNLAEAEKRDHRKLGKELDLFHIDETVGIGLPLWHPKGALLWRIIEEFWYKKHLENGYDLVRTPHIGKRILWETSGHWGFYNSSMYPPMEVGQSLEERQNNQKVKESEEFLLKPMNCPFHVEIYKADLRSYRELPFRWAECGTVYRFEKKGELNGLIRVRGFTQDDAHIICRKNQVEDELKRVIDFILFIYESFGFPKDSVHVYLSLRDDKNKDKYAGSDEGWRFTETVLRQVAKKSKLNFKEEKGEAAFYGPKLDFKICDALGREWQCSTLQFDFNLPERFDMSYINEKGQPEKPYMLHRALFGSFERFIGLLIEHYAGAFPVWLAPVQVKIIPVGQEHIASSDKLLEKLKADGIRAEVDSLNETVGNKIRKAEKEKVPYMLVIGDKEKNLKKVALRVRGNRQIEEMALTDFLNKINKENKEKKI